MKKSKKSKSILDKYNERETKGDVGNTFLKSVVDIIAGAAIGPGIAAVTGRFSPLAGILMIASGHYLGDKSGVLRATGTSTLAFGIAKAKEYKENPELNTSEKRLKGLGNDLLSTLHTKWKSEQNDNAPDLEESESEDTVEKQSDSARTMRAGRSKDSNSEKNELNTSANETTIDVKKGETAVTGDNAAKSEEQPESKSDINTSLNDEIDFSVM